MLLFLISEGPPSTVPIKSAIRSKPEAAWIFAESGDFAAALLLGHASGVPSVSDRVLISPATHFFQHTFPLGLERGRCDDEDALRFSKTVEQCTRSDGLNGFTEAHFIGKQRAFRKSEVEHALALIGVKRAEGDVFRVASFDHAVVTLTS